MLWDHMHHNLVKKRDGRLLICTGITTIQCQIRCIKINKTTNIVSLAMIFIGLISCIIAFSNDSHSAWTSLLFNNYFF